MSDNALKPASRSVPNSRLTCAQCERMILDAMEGTLGPEDRTQFDLHLAGCPDCSRAMADAQRGVAWLEMLQAAPPEPPGELVMRILAQTSGDPATALPLRPRNEPLLAFHGGTIPAAQAGFAPGVMGQIAPFPGLGNWFTRLRAGFAQPRFAMTAAMAFFSVAITMNLTGVSLRDLHGSSLKPANLRHTFWSANARVVRYYENLRVVYELESRVRELQRSTDDSGFVRRTSSAPAEVEQPAPDPATVQRPHGQRPQPGNAVPQGGPARSPEQPVQRKPADHNPALQTPALRDAAPANGKSSASPSPGAHLPRQKSESGTALALRVQPAGLSGQSLTTTSVAAPRHKGVPA